MREATVVTQYGWETKKEKRLVKIPITIMDDMGNEVPILDELGQPMFTEEEQEVTVVNRPTTKIHKNEDVYIDPTCEGDMEACQFIIVKHQSNMSLLKQNPLYKNLNSIDTSISDINEEHPTFKFDDEPRKQLTVYEYWGNYDVDGDGIAEPIVCVWVNNTIIRLEDNPFPDKEIPFIISTHEALPFETYGIADAEIGSNFQRNRTAYMRGFIENASQANNGAIGFKKGSITLANIKKLENKEYFEYQGNKEDIFQPTFSPIPASAFNMYTLLEKEHEAVTAVNGHNADYTAGGGSFSASATKGTLSALEQRKAEKLLAIAETFVKPLVRKMMMMNNEWLLEEQVVRMTNSEFIPSDENDLNGEIDIDIAISSAEEDSIKAQQLAFLLQTGQQSMPQEFVRMIQAKIARLQNMPDLAKTIEEYQPEPNPMQEKMAELEVAMKEAQVQNETAKGQENAVDVKLKEAKTRNELAKVRKVNSETDMVDLNFLEKESGEQRANELMDKDTARLSKLDEIAMKEQAKGVINKQQQGII